MPMSEATFSANFRLVMANNNLPVNLTLRADETASSEEFVGTLSDLVNLMLTTGWNTREASLGPNQDIQEASAYIVGRSSQGVRIVHLFKPPLEKRTGYVYEEHFDKLPFRLTGKEPEYPVPGVNPQLPRDEQHLVKLPGTFQFIRTAQPAKDGGMAAKRYTAIYFAPASMQIELEEVKAEVISVPAGGAQPQATKTAGAHPLNSNGARHIESTQATAEQLREFMQLCRNVFGEPDAEEAAHFLTLRYTSALNTELRGPHGVHEDPTKLTSGQIGFVFQTVGNNSGKYLADWQQHKLGWLSRKRQTEPS